MRLGQPTRLPAYGITREEYLRRTVAPLPTRPPVEPPGPSWSELVAHLRQPWRQAAACRGKPVDLFVPRSDRAPCDAARAICATCPVTVECRAEAERTGDVGVWGGLDERERRAQRAGAARS